MSKIIYRNKKMRNRKITQKALSFCLILSICLSLCACENNVKTSETTEFSTVEPSTTASPTETASKFVQLALGETASTDLAEFTLEHSEFTYYVSNVSSNYVEPTSESNNMFAASIGHCYVSVTFTITNKDRGGSISYADSFSDWNPGWIVSYDGSDYLVKGYQLNNRDGSIPMSLAFSAVVDRETGEVIQKHTSSNYLLRAGETVTLRAFGIVDFEPENLTDSFDFSIAVPNSKNEYEYFTYSVPIQS